MKKIALSAALFVLTGFLSLQAQSIAHTVWKTYFGDPINDTISWHFGMDSSYVLGSKNDVFVRSLVKISKDTLTISDFDGQYQCAGMDGVYTFMISGNTLNFTLINDPCQGRNAISGTKWIRVIEK
jgi:hypothetical protein